MKSYQHFTQPSQNVNAFVEFYEHLYGGSGDLEPTEYRLIKPTNDRPVIRSFTSNPDDLEADFAKLCQLNNAGFNVYAVVNRVDDTTLANIATGRPWNEYDADGNIKTRADGNPKQYFSTQNHHITGIRALFVDIDKPPTGDETNLQKLYNSPLTPSLIVQSSLEHKLQAYWLVDSDAILPSEFYTLQRQLADRFNADNAVTNTARILRVPGFLHVKDPKNPMLSRLIDADGAIYDRETILSSLELNPAPPQNAIGQIDLSNASADWDRVINAAAGWQPQHGVMRKFTILAVSIAYELGISLERAVLDVATIKQSWPTNDPVESTQSVADWVYGSRANLDHATLGQLLGSLSRDYGIECEPLDALKWQRQVAAINSRVHLPESAFDANINVDVRYLGTEWQSIKEQLGSAIREFEGLLEPHQRRCGAVVFVDAPVGSGKSTAIFDDETIRDSDSAAFVAPLISLCQSISGDTESVNYQTMQADDYRNYANLPSHRLTITPNSLPKLNAAKLEPHSDKFYTHTHIVLDESDAIVARLSDDDVTNEQSMFYALRSHIAGALLQNGVAIFSSAYHSPAELELINQILNELKLQYGIVVPKIQIRNHQQTAQGRSYELLEVTPERGVSRQQALRAALLKRVLEAKRDGKQVAIGTDAEAFANEIHEALQAAYPEQKHLLLTALTRNEPEQQAFLNDPKRSALKYDSVVYDPVLQSGFDIKRQNHDHAVFLYYCARSVSPLGAVQLAGRFRDAPHLTIASENYSHGGSRDVATIKRELIDSLEADQRFTKTTLDGRRVWVDEGFTDVHVANIAFDRWGRSSWRVHFLALLEGAGFTRRSVESQPMSETDVETYRDVRETVKQHEAVEIASAEMLTPEQADVLQRKTNPSRLEQRSLERFEYETYYGRNATPERVTEDRQQRRVISQLALARATDATLEYHRDSELTSAAFSDGYTRQKSADKLSRFALKRALLRWALAAACIELETLEQTSEYHRDSESVQAFIERVEYHRTALSAIGSIPQSADLRKNPLLYLGTILKKMGFVTESRLVRTETGRKRLYAASINPEMPTLLERLNERETVVAVRVEKWLERTHQTGGTQSDFLYRQDDSVNHVLDGNSDKWHTVCNSTKWGAVLGWLEATNDPETASILASLEAAGAYIENQGGKNRIIWEHCDLPMPPDEIKREFLMPHRHAIAAALASVDPLPPHTAHPSERMQT